MVESLNLPNRMDSLARANKRIVMDNCNSLAKLGFDDGTRRAQRDATHAVTINAFNVDSASIIIGLNNTHLSTC